MIFLVLSRRHVFCTNPFREAVEASTNLLTLSPCEAPQVSCKTLAEDVSRIIGKDLLEHLLWF